MKSMTLADLKFIVENVLTSMERRGFQGTEFNAEDLYWTIDPIDSFDMRKDAEIVVGSLHEDVMELLKLRDGVDWASPVDLERLSAIFSYLAKTVNESKF